MELSEYAILKLNEARVADAERAISRRRSRLENDPPPASVRDGLWAAAIHRWAERREAPHSATPPAARPERASGQATLGCASA